MEKVHNVPWVKGQERQFLCLVHNAIMQCLCFHRIWSRYEGVLWGQWVWTRYTVLWIGCTSFLDQVYCSLELVLCTLDQGSMQVFLCLQAGAWCNSAEEVLQHLINLCAPAAAVSRRDASNHSHYFMSIWRSSSMRKVGKLQTLHYRLRCTIGVLNVQKKSKSKLFFLTEGISKSKNFALFVKIMTQILYQKNFITFSESKYCQNHGQCSEKVERGLSKGWIFVW